MSASLPRLKGSLSSALSLSFTAKPIQNVLTLENLTPELLRQSHLAFSSRLVEESFSVLQFPQKIVCKSCLTSGLVTYLFSTKILSMPKNFLMPVIKTAQHTGKKHSFYFNVTKQFLLTEYLEQLTMQIA